MLELTKPEVDKLIGKITEVENSLIRVKSEQELVKEILADIKNDFKISPTLIRKVANFRIDSDKKNKAEQEWDDLDYLTELMKK